LIGEGIRKGASQKLPVIVKRPGENGSAAPRKKSLKGFPGGRKGPGQTRRTGGGKKALSPEHIRKGHRRKEEKKLFHATLFGVILRVLRGRGN